MGHAEAYKLTREYSENIRSSSNEEETGSRQEAAKGGARNPVRELGKQGDATEGSRTKKYAFTGDQAEVTYIEGVSLTPSEANAALSAVATDT